MRSSSGKRSNARERIIDAALAVVKEDGAARLSLDAVAERAGVSKGGLLYHFASKSALLKAMVARHVTAFRETMATAHAEVTQDGRPNALARAYLQAMRARICEKERSPSGFLAAIAEAPELLDPVREHHRQLVADLRSGSETPQLAFAAFLAIEGFWSLQLFETNPFSASEVVACFDVLEEMLGQAER